QHVEARLDRQWMGSGEESLAFLILGSGRRGRLRRRGRRAGSEQRCRGEDEGPHHGSTASAPGRRGSAAPRYSPLSIMIDCPLPIVSSLVIGWPIAFSSLIVSGLKLGSIRKASTAP